MYFDYRISKNNPINARSFDYYDRLSDNHPIHLREFGGKVSQDNALNKRNYRKTYSLCEDNALNKRIHRETSKFFIKLHRDLKMPMSSSLREIYNK